MSKDPKDLDPSLSIEDRFNQQSVGRMQRNGVSGMLGSSRYPELYKTLPSDPKDPEGRTHERDPKHPALAKQDAKDALSDAPVLSSWALKDGVRHRRGRGIGHYYSESTLDSGSITPSGDAKDLEDRSGLRLYREIKNAIEDPKNPSEGKQPW